MCAPDFDPRGWHDVRRFNRKRFSVALQVTNEPYPDLSFDETGETQAKVASGEWGVYLFRVAVHCDGRLVGVDYIGNNIYADPSDFAKEHIGSRGASGSYFSDMVHEAVAEARKALADVPYIRRAA